MPSTRRLTTLAGAVFVGVAATALFASPASAHVAEVAGKADCANGTYTIHWTITDKFNDHDVTMMNVKPAGLKTTKGELLEGLPVKRATSIQADQTLPGSTTGPVTLSFEPKWDDNWPDGPKTYSGTVTLKKDGCKPQPECPPSAEAKGAHPTPTCPPSPAPSTKPTPAPSKSSAPPALPVTGSQTGLYAGGAVVLLGAGAGLFMVARRRRLKFEA
jgi:LPXTG-motif cell wall-anchored protein